MRVFLACLACTHGHKRDRNKNDKVRNVKIVVKSINILYDYTIYK